MPLPLLIPAAMAAAGALSGALSGQKEGGKDAGNIFGLKPGQAPALTQDYLQNIKNTQGAVTGGTEGFGQATKDIQGNAMLGQLYGQGGTLGRTTQEEQQLANQGFQLTPEDRTAYGQASGDIARQFGESDQSLAQALSDRGLSNSGVAGAAFSGSQGNKMEQLAKAQQNIANQRFQSNLQRLGQTRQFLGQLGQQGEQAVQNQFGNIQEGNRAQRAASGQANQDIMKLLGANQNQANTALQQQQQTEHESGLSKTLGGALRGFSSGMGGMMGGGGGMK